MIPARHLLSISRHTDIDCFEALVTQTWTALTLATQAWTCDSCQWLADNQNYQLLRLFIAIHTKLDHALHPPYTCNYQTHLHPKHTLHRHPPAPNTSPHPARTHPHPELAPTRTLNSHPPAPGARTHPHPAPAPTRTRRPHPPAPGARTHRTRQPHPPHPVPAPTAPDTRTLAPYLHVHC